MSSLVELKTGTGTIDIELDYKYAPRTAGHFASLVESGVLDDACFYRIVHSTVASEFGGIDVIQGGVGWERADESPTVAHESTLETGLTHCHGAISLGRSQDADAGSEFFICIGDQSKLDARGSGTGAQAGFAVFGQVVKGMDVVERIHHMPADGDPPGGDDRFRGQFLTESVRIESAKLKDTYEE